MRSTKKILASALAVCMLASTSVVSGFAATTSGDTGAAVNNYAKAARNLGTDYGYSGNDLGAVYSPEKTVFKLWSPTATEVILLRFFIFLFPLFSHFGFFPIIIPFVQSEK